MREHCFDSSLGGGHTRTARARTRAMGLVGGSVTDDDTTPVLSVPEVGVVQFAQGWVMSPFNGSFGRPLSDLIQVMEGAVNNF